MTSIRILVVDDHPIVRDGLVAILSTQSDFQVVGEAVDGIDAVAKAAQLEPDVLLLDLEMPRLDGVGVLEQLRAAGSKARAVVFTVFDTDERIVQALKAGAQGYLLKGAPRDDIFRAVRVVSRGGSLLEPVVASKLLRHLSAPAKLPEGEALTERELEVLRLLALGRVNKDIAMALFISERTVKFHVSAILAKLGASNRTEAVAMAAHQGLVSL